MKKVGFDNEKYLKKHEFLKNFINENLFEDGFFRAYHYYDDEDPTKAKDKKQVFPKELIGFIPFMFDIPEKGREECFDLLLDDKCFYNEYGLTSLEKTNERFLYEVNHECLWNGYIWPYATTQTIDACAAVMNRYGNEIMSNEGLTPEQRTEQVCTHCKPETRITRIDSEPRRCSLSFR